MNAKAYLITGYLIIALFVSFYFKGCSDTSDKDYAFNLGKAMAWPISLLIFHGR